MWSKYGSCLNSGQKVLKLLKKIEGRLPLHIAAESGDVETVQVLLQRWPESLKITSRNGRLPLHFASMSNHVELVRLLLQMWPDSVKAVDNGGGLPLHMAACCGSLELVQLLLENWPEGLHVVDNDGSTALARTGYNVEKARWMFQMSPPPSYTPNLDCEVLIELACNTTEASQSWKDAARDLKCSNKRWLTKPELHLWLDFCDASPNFRDGSGSRLIDLLFISEAQDEHILTSNYSSFTSSPEREPELFVFQARCPYSICIRGSHSVKRIRQ